MESAARLDSADAAMKNPVQNNVMQDEHHNFYRPSSFLVCANACGCVPNTE